MSDQTNISWTDSTWNPWRGCTKVSAGCRNCYAERLVTTRMGGKWGKGAPRVRAAKATFNAPLRWNKKPWVCACGTPMESPIKGPWSDCDHKPHRRRVFFGSLMDWLDPEVPVEWLADALDIVRSCPDLTFQCVTKRPELWQQRLCDVCNWRKATGEGKQPEELFYWVERWLDDDPPANVHILTSIEDQASADERIPHLLKIPAPVHGVSAEPLLEHINIEQYLLSDYDKAAMDNQLIQPLQGFNYDKVNWVIAGLESGSGRRDPGVGVIADGWDAPKPGLLVQCQEYGTPFYCKQDCAARPGMQWRIPDEIWKIKQFPL